MNARPALFVGLALAAVTAAWLCWRPRQSAPPPATAVGPPAAAPEADFPRTPELARALRLVNALGATLEDYDLAEDLVKQVLEQAPDDPEAVTVYAEVNNEFVGRGFDVSAERRALAKRYAERAVQLAPAQPQALAALGIYLALNHGDPARAAALLRQAIALDPQQPRAYRALFGVMLALQPDQALPLAEQAAARFPEDALIRYDLARLYRDAGRFAAMEKSLDETLALEPITSAIVGKARLTLWLHGDVAGMKAWLERVPARQQLNDRSVLSRYFLACVSGQPADGLPPLRALLEDWIDDFDYNGPKALLVGDLLLLQGQAAAAREQYEAAFAQVVREKAHNPAGESTRAAEEWTLYRLGRLDEARAVSRALVAALPHPYRMPVNWWFGPIPASLLLGERDQALQLIREASTSDEARRLIAVALRTDPRMAPFRSDPAIQRLLAGPAPTGP